MPYIKNGAFAGFKSKQSPEDKDQNLSAIQGTGVAYTGGTQGAASYGQTNAGAGDLGGGNGRFINFSRYFDQNKAGATAMADSLGNKAQKTAQEAGKAVNAQNQAFRSAADAGTVQYDPNKRAAAAVESYSTNVPDSNLQTKKQGLQQVTPSTYSRGDLSAGANATYSGPKSLVELQGYQGVSDAVDKANSAVNGLQPFEGIQTSLQDEYGKQGSYTQGDSLFDAALTQNAGAGKFADLKKKYSGLSGALSAAQQNAQNYANAAGVTSQQNAGIFKALASGYDDAQRKAEEEAQARAAAAEAQANDATATATRNENLANNDEVVQINAARQADLDGLTTAWENAGKPLPYDAWKEAYMAGKA